jgi:hypothetical protein
MEKTWSRGDKLTVGGLLLAAVAAIAAVLVVPEFRQFFHLDHSQTAQAEAKPPQSVAPSTSPVQNTEPSKPNTSNPKKTKKPTQKTTTHVTGNDNVAGNNTSGDNNVTGNNNQTGATANAPNGIAITGGTVNNPTVNNFTPPSRRLADDEKTALKTCLAMKTGTFTVAALANNGEAYQYAKDFYDVFSGAGWKNEQPIPVAIIMIGGGMWTGVRISVHGTG